jgi:hypothetical protein
MPNPVYKTGEFWTFRHMNYVGRLYPTEEDAWDGLRDYIKKKLAIK